MGSLGDQLAAARARLNLTQGQAAELLGTRQANVSAYERGRLEPGRVVAARITAFANLTVDSIYVGYSASTLPSAAAQLRLDLRDERSEGDMLRVIIQASDDFARLRTGTDRQFFLTEPTPTGSRKWDAMLAGLAVHLCETVGHRASPPWADEPSRTVDFRWWVDSTAVSLQPMLLRHSIPSMRERGVILSRRALESV